MVLRYDEATERELDFSTALPTGETGLLHDARWVRYRASAPEPTLTWLAARHGVVVGYAVARRDPNAVEIVDLDWALDDEDALRALLATLASASDRARTVFEAASAGDTLLTVLQDLGFRATASRESVV